MEGTSKRLRWRRINVPGGTSRSVSDRLSRSAGVASMAAESSSTDVAMSCAITVGLEAHASPVREARIHELVE
jgi:hypothetical protein